jgi:hypothetical protein
MSQNLKAPNGKPSNLTPAQWKLVRTPQFRAWFGDWENDPENASKVVDENGEPLVVYHATDKWELNGAFKNIRRDIQGAKHRDELGIHFGSKEQANQILELWSGKKSTIGKYIKPFFLNVRNLKRVKDRNTWDFRVFEKHYEDLGLSHSKKFESIDEVYEELKNQKIDGLIYYNEYEDEGDSYSIFDSTQIKLANGTNTTFDGSNPDIRFAEGGEVNSNSFMKWFVQWYKAISNKVNISFSLSNHLQPFKEKNVVILDTFEKIDQSIDARPYLQEIVQKADEYGVVIYLEPKPRHKVGYYENFGFELTPNKLFMKRKPSNPDIRFAEGGMISNVQQGDALIYKDSEFLDFDSVIYVNGVTENVNGTLVSLSNGQRMFLPQVAEKFRVATQSEVNRSEIMGKQLFGKGGVVQPKDLRKTPNFDNIYKGAEFYSFSDNQEKQTKADKWFLLFLKNQKGRKLTKNEFAEFIQLSNELAWEEFEQGGNTKTTMKKIKRGGITYGKSHAEGGIPVKNQSTGDMLEVEGGEGIVNKRSMASDKKVKLNGKEMTICEAVSQLNQLEGGVQFSCDDVEHQQFIEAMAKGGELERGTKTEMEHYKTLNDLYAKRITPKEASERIAKDHIKEDSHYYSKLAKMEGKMADGGEIEIGKTYLIGRPEVFKSGRFGRARATYKTIRIGENGEKRFGEQSFEISGSAKNVNFGENYIKVTQKAFDKMYSRIEGKMANGGKFNVKYDVTQKPDEDGFYFIIYTQTGKIVPSSKIPQELGYGQVKNQFFAKRKKYDNSLGLQDAIFIAMKMNELDEKMADGGTTADNPFAEFGLKKDFSEDALAKLDKLEEVSANYCEVNKENCESNVGVDRKDMPQIYEEHMDEYIDFLDSKGITYEMDFGVEVGKLKPTQENISIPRIKKILTRLLNGYYTDTKGLKLNPLSRRLIATRDGYILDGHHRWASLLFLSPNNKMDVLRINARINDLISVSKDFDLASVSEFAYGGKVEVKVPNYTSSDEKDITTTIVKRNGFPTSGVTLSPTLTYDYDVATGTALNRGYTDEMFTITIGKRSLTKNRAFSVASFVSDTLNKLKTTDKYKDKFSDIEFVRDSDSQTRLVRSAKNLYKRYTDQRGGVEPKMIIILGTEDKNSVDLSIWFPPMLSNLKDDEDIFDMFFDAINENTKTPNRNVEEEKKTAKEESKKRKEKLKQVENRFSNATGYPKKMKAYNPRTLYRLKTEAEIMAQYNTTDWKRIADQMNCDWIKKPTNRKILGLIVNKDAQYIMKYLFSPMYIGIWQSSITNSQMFRTYDFDKVFDVDFSAFKIKKNEIDWIITDLFTIEQEDFYTEKDWVEDVGAKILNQEELNSTTLDKDDFYKTAIQLAEVDEVTDMYVKKSYEKWFSGKIAPIFESDYNAYIPSEIWQFLKMLEELNLNFKDFTTIDLNLKSVNYLDKKDGKYLGVGYDEKTIINDDVDVRVVEFLRFMEFYSNRQFRGEQMSNISNILSNKGKNDKYGERLFQYTLQVILKTFKIGWLSQQPMKSYEEAQQPRGLQETINYDYRRLTTNFLAVYDDLYNSNVGGSYNINSSSEFFQEVDFNVSKFDWEFRYLSEEQCGGGTQSSMSMYISQIFFNSVNYQTTDLTLQKIGLNDNAKDLLGTELKPELVDVFADYMYNDRPYTGSAEKLTAGKSWEDRRFTSLAEIEQDGNGFRLISGSKEYVPIKIISWMEFLRDSLDTNIANSRLIDFSYFYNGKTPKMVEGLYIQNPYYTLSNIANENSYNDIMGNSIRTRYYQCLPKITSKSQVSLAKKKNSFEQRISALTSLLKIFEADEPLKQKMIFDKISKIRKEQEEFVQTKYFKGDLSNLLQLYSNGQKLGGQRAVSEIACGLQTPTGEPSELDLEQYKLVRTPAFKKWFGDWELAYQEQDYSAVSKAINPKTAEPIVCYHGKGNMKAEATYFNLANFPVKYVGTNLSYSVWFANMGNPLSVIYEFYAQCINPIDLSVAKLGSITPIEFKEIIKSLYGYEIQTRMVSEDRPQKIWQMLRANPLMLKEIRDNTEYDSIILYEDNPSDILPNGEPNSTLDYVIFENKQLKSADNRNSTFLIDSPDFRFDDGGLITTHI